MFQVIKGNLIKEIQLISHRKVSTLFTVLNSFLLFIALYTLFNNVIHVDDTSKAIFIVSYVLWYFSLSLITEPGWIIIGESSRGTIEQWYLSPYPLWYILFSKIISANFVNSLRTLLLLFLIVITTNSIIIFKPLTVAIIVISLFGMYGIGFIFGALSLIYKRIQDIIPILQYLLLAIISLPASSNIFANIIPIYSTSSLLKRLLDNNDILFSEYILFSFSSIFYLIIGVLLFNSCDKFVRKKGIVGRL